MKPPRTSLLDVVLTLWIVLTAAQHLSLAAAAVWWPPGLEARVDLRVGYVALGMALLAGVAARWFLPRREVACDW